MKKSVFLLASTVMCASVFLGCGSTDEVSVSNKKNASVAVEATEASVTDNVLETKESVEVEENTLYFSCNTNEENTPGCISANEAEGESMDCFFISGKYLFLDDTVGNRILVYKDLVFDHEIPLSENQDVKDIFYDSAKNVLKAVYENRDYTDATHYYYMEISVEDGSIITDKELSNAKNVLLSFYFDAAGTLNTHFKGDESTEEKTAIYNKMKETLPNYYDYECCYENADTAERIYSVFDTKKEEERTSILLFEKDEITKYAVPQEYLVTKGRLKKLDGNLYELVPSEDKIEIYLLAEKNFDGNELESYVLDAE